MLLFKLDDKEIKVPLTLIKNSKDWVYIDEVQLKRIAKELRGLDNYDYSDFTGIDIRDKENHIWYLTNMDSTKLYIRKIPNQIKEIPETNGTKTNKKKKKK